MVFFNAKNDHVKSLKINQNSFSHVKEQKRKLEAEIGDRERKST